MAKTIVGVDIGTDSLKLAMVKGSQVKKTASVSMPQGLIREGRVVSTQSMAELIRTTMKENKIHGNQAALILSNESVFIRNVSMPWMNAEQLAYNLPFEFRDYISDELKNYVCDYAMISTPEELKAQTNEPMEEGIGRRMDLTAVAAPISLIEESTDMCRMAGLKLVKAAPAISAFAGLIRNASARGKALPAELCILDLGYQAIRMYIFRGDRHEVTRELEIGLSSLDNVIAEAYNVDVHLAHTYLLNNFENCQNREFCNNAYSNIAVELMRALNFFRFSNPESQLEDVWLCGGGAAITALKKAISETLDLSIHDAEELLPALGTEENVSSLAQAIGITMD